MNEDIPSQGLLDTSVLIARESGRPLDAEMIPEVSYVSVITAAELEAGVHAARDAAARAARLHTWARVAELELLGVDLGVAHEWALLRYRLAEAGRRANVNDVWIAAIALANGLAVVTQDDDFDVLAGIGGPQIIKV